MPMNLSKSNNHANFAADRLTEFCAIARFSSETIMPVMQCRVLSRSHVANYHVCMQIFHIKKQIWSFFPNGETTSAAWRHLAIEISLYIRFPPFMTNINSETTLKWWKIEGNHVIIKPVSNCYSLTSFRAVAPYSGEIDCFLKTVIQQYNNVRLEWMLMQDLNLASCWWLHFT